MWPRSLPPTSADGRRSETEPVSLAVTKMPWKFLYIFAKCRCPGLGSTSLLPLQGLCGGHAPCVWWAVLCWWWWLVLSPREFMFWTLSNVIFYGVKTWLICCLLDRKCLKENEENKNQVSKKCREHERFLAQLHDCLDPDKKNGMASDEDFILKVFVRTLKRLYI